MKFNLILVFLKNSTYSLCLDNSEFLKSSSYYSISLILFSKASTYFSNSSISISICLHYDPI